MLGSNDLKKRIEAIDSVLLLTDADSLIGTPDAVEKIKQLDKDINGTKFLSDEIFNNSIYNSYVQKIESIAVKGDPNADYEYRYSASVDAMEIFISTANPFMCDESGFNFDSK